MRDVPSEKVPFYNLINTVPIATRRWRNTAKLKLNSAGFDNSNVNIVSSDDHFSREKIIKNASNKHPDKLDPTYFGDADWDVKAFCF